MSVEAALDGERFYAVHRAKAVALAAALTGRTDVAEDIAQDSLLKTIARLESLREPRAYLRIVVVNGCRSWHRSTSRETARLHRSLSDRSNEVSVESNEMLALLDQLPYRHRAALQLRFWGGWSDAEIAAVLKCRPASVRVFAHRGLVALRKQLDEGRNL